jgi:hypothetical protein
MKKRGGALMVIGIIILVLVVLAIVVGIYFYNFYVFKTVRVCVGEGVDSEVPCDVTQVCVDLINEQQNIEAGLEGAPDFVRENFQGIFDEAVYCDGTCYIKDIRGVNYETQELEDLENCDVGETEFVMEIRGKEGIEVLNWIKSRG